MVSYAFGDEFFVAMFMFGGIDKGIVVSDEDEARAEIERVCGSLDTTLVVVKKGVLGADAITRIRADANMPMIAEVAAPGDNVE